MSAIPLGGALLFLSAEGFLVLTQPLSAQAQPPRRPSGADKKQQPANKEGGQGRSRNRRDGRGHSTLNSRHFAANQHCQTLEEAKSSAKTIDGSLPGGRSEAVLDEKYARPQCQKMVRRGDLKASAPATDQYLAGINGCRTRLTLAHLLLLHRNAKWIEVLAAGFS
jgi:hypothetical protein